MRRAPWCVVLLLGCGPGFDEGSVLARAAGRRTSGFMQINRDAFLSQHMGMSVNVWVSAAAAPAYRAAGAMPDGGAAAFPEGTVIVKEQLLSGGDVGLLTVMAKGPVGHAPGSDDWFWAQTNPEGAVNAGRSGQVGFCIQCHAPRAAADWVWGVPRDNQR